MITNDWGPPEILLLLICVHLVDVTIIPVGFVNWTEKFL